MPCSDSRDLENTPAYRFGFADGASAASSTATGVDSLRRALEDTRSRLDAATRAACTACELLEVCVRLVPGFQTDADVMQLRSWWSRHQRADRDREARAALAEPAPDLVRVAAGRLSAVIGILLDPDRVEVSDRRWEFRHWPEDDPRGDDYHDELRETHDALMAALDGRQPAAECDE
jgi:hypothetical protein